MKRTLWTNAKLVTLANYAPWGLIEKGSMSTNGDTLMWVGPESDLSAEWHDTAHVQHDLDGAVVTHRSAAV